MLFARDESRDAAIGISGVAAARPVSPSLEAMRGWLATLEQGLARDERAAPFTSCTTQCRVGGAVA